MKQLIQCEKNGVKGWKLGEEGECFLGLDAKQKALRAEAKKSAEKYAKEPKESTKEFLKKHQAARAERLKEKQSAKKSTKN